MIFAFARLFSSFLIFALDTRGLRLILSDFVQSALNVTRGLGEVVESWKCLLNEPSELPEVHFELSVLSSW